MYIVATISKNSYPAEKVREILVAGATVLRYNFSHGTPEEMQIKVGIGRQVIAELGLVGQVRIMADLPGDKIRLGSFPDQELSALEGERVTFRSGTSSADARTFIPVDKEGVAALVAVGDVISTGDGDVALRVENVLADAFEAVVLNSGRICALKAINLGRAIDTLNHLTDKTLAHLRQLDAIKPELVAFSFVNSASYAEQAKKLLQELAPQTTKQAKLVAKVETEQGLKNIDDIAHLFDILLVARGDLGLTMPIEALGLSQKVIVAAGKAAKKEVIVSTQILDSLLTSFTPFRSDVLDLTNIVLDGADGIMLARETGISLTPGRSVATAKRIIEYVEQHN